MAYLGLLEDETHGRLRKERMLKYQQGLLANDDEWLLTASSCAPVLGATEKYLQEPSRANPSSSADNIGLCGDRDLSEGSGWQVRHDSLPLSICQTCLEISLVCHISTQSFLIWWRSRKQKSMICDKVWFPRWNLFYWLHSCCFKEAKSESVH